VRGQARRIDSFSCPYSRTLVRSWFPSIFTRLVWSIIVCQLAVGAILGLHRFAYAALLFIVFVITLLMWIWADRQMHRHFKFGVVGLQERYPGRWPGGETYRYPTLRPPLFHVEEQSPEVPETPDDDWWPVEYEGDKDGEMRGKQLYEQYRHVGLEEQFELSQTVLL
jgi:hypothetical protein